MFYIEEGDEVVLSQEFHRLRNMSVMLHDQMAYLLGSDEYVWLAQSPPNETETNALTRDIFCAMLADFLHFIYESLSSAKKGKISVAYALLRKPMTDMLLLFEQILGDREEFIARFTQQDPVKYDPSVNTLDKLPFVVMACAKLKLAEVFDAEFIHALRYDKGSKYGIAGTVHRALHIVTRDKNYPTPPAYLNFVFDSVDSIASYWQNYYYVVSYLMCYAAAVMDEIAFTFLPGSSPVEHLKNIQRYILISDLSITPGSETTSPEHEEFLYQYLNEYLVHTCARCGHPVSFGKENFHVFTRYYEVPCSVCSYNQLEDVGFSDKFHTAWERVVPM